MPALSPAPVGAGHLHVLEVIGNAIVGGMESWVARLIEKLPSKDFLVTALCPFESPFTERLRHRGVEVLITPMPDDPPWASIQMTASLVQAGGIDLLHAHLPNAHLLAGLAARLTGKPVLATIHGRQLTTLDLEVHRAVGSHLSVVCRQSYFHALGLGVNAGQLSCDTNGVDTQVFQPRPAPAQGLRHRLGLAAGTPLVGCVGRLSPEKGPDIFVRAALLLRSRAPDAHCVLVGEGPLEKPVRDLIVRHGLDNWIHMVGVVDDMPTLYNELDVVVSSSLSEAMPLALMEAMASACPVVATRVGGVPDMIEHGQTGWLTASGDFDDIAVRCATLIADPALRARMGERGRRRVMERMNLDDSVARVSKLLERLGRRPAPRPRRTGAAVVRAVGGNEVAAPQRAGTRRSARDG
jgi:glycosyltransferase involved in cell wall biosynthesis